MKITLDITDLQNKTSNPTIDDFNLDNRMWQKASYIEFIDENGEVTIFKSRNLDGGCKCHKIVAEINRQYPHADWNCDEACNAWCLRKEELINTGVEGEEYCCNCPTCGRTICSWCS